MLAAKKPSEKLDLSLPTARVFLPLLKRRRFRGIKGGRGSGKSHFVGEDLVQDSLGRHVRAVCGREIQNSIRDSSKQLIEDKINAIAATIQQPLLRKKFLGQWRITEREIVYKPTESLYIFKGLQNHTAASIKSLEGFTDLWLEEAQTISQRSLDLAIPTFRSDSQITFTWNPLSAKDPVEKLFKENGVLAQKLGMARPVEQDEDFCLVEANYYDNPWFPDELRRDMERDKRRDPDKYAHVWLGRYQGMSEARVFRNWEVLEFETPANARFYFGADWGFSVDPSVAVRCWLGRLVGQQKITLPDGKIQLVGGTAVPDPKGDVLFIDYEAYAVGCEIDNTPALFGGTDTQKPPRWENPNGYKGIPGATEWPMIGDNARPETISYMRRHGFPRIRPCVKGAGSVEDGLEFLKNFDIRVHPRCVNTIDELSTYSYKVDQKTNEVLPVLEDKKNHVIDAVRYGLEATRRSNYTLANV
ncbi:terminase large subunit [Aminobacter phage Erebus]|nr:terminase large subunit [Aminobacter phage Erebus]